MKKPIILGSIIALLGTSAVFANTNVFINGEYLQFKDAKPIIRNERTTVPVSAIAKNLGIDYTWNNDTKTVTFKQDEKELDLRIGEENSFVENGRTYVPLKFIAEHFNEDVDWRANSKTVVIGENAKDVKVPEIEVIEKEVEEVKKHKDNKKEYNELSDFKSTHISKSEIFNKAKDVRFRIDNRDEWGKAEDIENVYHLKKEDLPIRIGNAVITKLEKDVAPNRVDVPDRQEVVMVSGYVLEGDITKSSLTGAFIDNNGLYRHRGFMGLDMIHHNHFVGKYPYLKGLNDKGQNLSETKAGEKFTYVMPLTNAGSDIEDDWYKFQIGQADKIVLYSWELGKDILVFDNFLK